jgi:hypothetical protein
MDSWMIRFITGWQKTEMRIIAVTDRQHVK